MKKRICAFVLIVLSLFSLMSCKENPDFVIPGITGKPTLPQEKPNDPSIPEETEKITIKVYNTFSDKINPYFEEKIKKFELNNINYKIEVLRIGGYELAYDTIINKLNSNTQPAIVLGLPYYAANIYNSKHKDKLINLEERFISTDKEFNVNNFIENYYNDSKINNDLYSLPYNRSSSVMYVNTDLLGKAGVSINELATWDCLFKVGGALDKLKTLNLRHAPIGFDRTNDLFMTLCEQYGIPCLANGPTAETSLLFNNEKAALLLENLTKEYEDNKLTTSTMLASYVSDSYIRGEVAICVDRSNATVHCDPNNKFNYEILPYPKKDINSKVVSNGYNILMFEQENDEIENKAWEFVKTLYEDDILANISMEMAVNPVTKSVYEYPLFREFLSSNTINAKAINAVDKMRDDLYMPPLVQKYISVLSQLRYVVENSFGVRGTEIPQRVRKELLNAYNECLFYYN